VFIYFSKTKVGKIMKLIFSPLHLLEYHIPGAGVLLACGRRHAA